MQISLVIDLYGGRGTKAMTTILIRAWLVLTLNPAPIISACTPVNRLRSVYRAAQKKISYVIIAISLSIATNFHNFRLINY